MNRGYYVMGSSTKSRIKEGERFDINARLSQVDNWMLRLTHDGVVDRVGIMAAQQLSSGGKRIRSRIALEAAHCLNVSTEESVVWAAAVELLHNATLVHDDIQDGDRIRRGRKTVWAEHGINQAINAGDYLLMLPFVALRELSAERRGELSFLIATAATQIVRGQSREMGLLDAGQLDLQNYYAAAGGKTGALFALPVAGAAVLAGRNTSEAAFVAEPFGRAGLLFQLQDDVIDLFGDKGRGEVGSDIKEGKVSALIVTLLERAPELTTTVVSILRKERDRTTSEDVEFVRAACLRTGALDQVLEEIRCLSEAVLGASIFGVEPAMRNVAAELVHHALRPVAHLMIPRQGRSAGGVG